MQISHILISFISGTFFGSFFYTLALRFASGEIRRSWKTALFSSSRCPACSARISPLYLVPVAGYFLSGRKCRSCNARISHLYPAMETAYGLLALLIIYYMGMNFYGMNIFLLAGLGLCMAVVDIKTLTIPNPLIAAFLALSAYPLVLKSDPVDNLYGLAFMFVFFLVVLLVFPGSFGGGDVKLASCIGLLLGIELSVVALEGALISGALAGIIYALATGKGFKSRIPFGPFLIIGLITALLFGRDILVLYYNILY
mgnify:CR=1 FL=1